MIGTVAAIGVGGGGTRFSSGKVGGKGNAVATLAGTAVSRGQPAGRVSKMAASSATTTKGRYDGYWLRMGPAPGITHAHSRVCEPWFNYSPPDTI